MNSFFKFLLVIIGIVIIVPAILFMLMVAGPLIELLQGRICADPEIVFWFFWALLFVYIAKVIWEN